MKIDLKQLRAVTNRLLDHVIETRGVTEIEVKQPFYWQITEPGLYDMSKDEQELEILTGSLADDWEFLSGLLKTDADPVAYQLTELAPLIFYIGTKLGEELASKGG